MWKTSPPTVPRRREAPTTAIEEGLRKRRTAASAASRSRSSKRSVASAEKEVGSSHLDRTRDRGDLDREAALAEDLDHTVVLGQHLGDEDGDAVLLGDLGEMGEQDRAEALALHRVVYREGDLGTPGRAADVGAMTDETVLAAARRDQAVAIGVVDLGHVKRRLLEVGRAGEEAEHSRVLAEPAQEVEQGGLVAAAHRAQVDRGAVAKHDIRFAVGGICAHVSIVRGYSRRRCSTSATRPASTTIRLR